MDFQVTDGRQRTMLDLVIKPQIYLPAKESFMCAIDKAAQMAYGGYRKTRPHLELPLCAHAAQTIFSIADAEIIIYGGTSVNRRFAWQI